MPNTQGENRSPWQQKKRRRIGGGGVTRILSNTFDEGFSRNINENMDLDLNTKLSALKVSQSVVSLVSRTDDDHAPAPAPAPAPYPSPLPSLFRGNQNDNRIIFVCSGTIVGCELEEEEDDDDSLFTHTILTSASLLVTRASSKATDPPVAPHPSIKVDVYVFGGDSFEGETFGFNFHYNIAVIKFKSKKCFPVAILKNNIDGSIPLAPKNEFPGSKGSSGLHLCHGEKVIALGRHYLRHVLMAAPGAFSLGPCDFDCVELMRASCRITICGIGGPLINCNGEVIGINFFDSYYTPFLPINIAFKCFDYLANNGRVPQPWFGVKVTSLDALTANMLEKIIQKLGSISGGVLVEDVTPESPANSSGILPNDIVIRCGKKTVGSSSEFFETLLDNAGESMELTVARPSNGRNLNLTTSIIDETSPSKCNRWPIPDETLILCSSRSS